MSLFLPDVATPLRKEWGSTWRWNPSGNLFWLQIGQLHYLVGGFNPSLKNISQSMGRMTSHNMPYMKWKIKAIFETTNQLFIEFNRCVFPPFAHDTWGIPVIPPLEPVAVHI